MSQPSLAEVTQKLADKQFWKKFFVTQVRTIQSWDLGAPSGGLPDLSMHQHGASDGHLGSLDCTKMDHLTLGLELLWLKHNSPFSKARWLSQWCG